jgi:hypothetical protein
VAGSRRSREGTAAGTLITEGAEIKARVSKTAE